MLAVELLLFWLACLFRAAAAAARQQYSGPIIEDLTGADALDPYALAQQPGDAVAAEGASAAVADTTAAVSFSRVGWLG